VESIQEGSEEAGGTRETFEIESSSIKLYINLNLNIPPRLGTGLEPQHQKHKMQAILIQLMSLMSPSIRLNHMRLKLLFVSRRILLYHGGLYASVTCPFISSHATTTIWSKHLQTHSVCWYLTSLRVSSFFDLVLSWLLLPAIKINTYSAYCTVGYRYLPRYPGTVQDIRTIYMCTCLDYTNYFVANVSKDHRNESRGTPTDNQQASLAIAAASTLA
jgi:hypothetical protein